MEFVRALHKGIMLGLPKAGQRLQVKTGRAGQGRVRQGWAGQGCSDTKAHLAFQGQARQDSADQGMAVQGRAVQGTTAGTPNALLVITARL